MGVNTEGDAALPARLLAIKQSRGPCTQEAIRQGFSLRLWQELNVFNSENQHTTYLACVIQQELSHGVLKVKALTVFQDDFYGISGFYLTLKCTAGQGMWLGRRMGVINYNATVHCVTRTLQYLERTKDVYNKSLKVTSSLTAQLLRGDVL